MYSIAQHSEIQMHISGAVEGAAEAEWLKTSQMRLVSRA